MVQGVRPVPSATSALAQSRTRVKGAAHILHQANTRAPKGTSHSSRLVRQVNLRCQLTYCFLLCEGQPQHACPLTINSLSQAWSAISVSHWHADKGCPGRSNW